MELQLQRQQAQAQRQTLDRLARRPPASSASQVVQPSQPAVSKQPHSLERSEQPQSVRQGGQGGFLLSSLAPDDVSSGGGTSQERQQDSNKQEMFLASLLLASLSLPSEQPQS